MAKDGKFPVIIGNWKMYKTIPEAVDFVKGLISHIKELPTPIYLAVPFTCIHPLSEEVEGAPLIIGAQNMNDATEGAFTGEIAGRMLKDAGAKFVILGHSERRRIFHEGNDIINKKVLRALSEGLRPVLCVGETKEERDNGNELEVVTKQLTECLRGVDAKNMDQIMIAYEPVWAIGTQLAATPEIADKMHKDCREVIADLYSKKAAKNCTIIYGGSVNIKNAAGFLDETNIDGLLIGGASLSLETFVEIVNTSSKIMKEV